MERITQDELCAMLERRWRKIAPKKLVAAMDGTAKQAASTAKKARKKLPAR